MKLFFFGQVSKSKGNKNWNKQKGSVKAQSICKTTETANRTAENTYKYMSDKGPILKL